MKKLGLCALLGLLMTGDIAPGAPEAAQGARDGTRKPNVLLFFTDDQGGADTSVRMMKECSDSRHDFFRTLALEQMAREGMVFSNAYSSAPTCTPSRAELQFGKTPCRLKQTVVHDRLAYDRGIDCKDQLSIYIMLYFNMYLIARSYPDLVNYLDAQGYLERVFGTARAYFQVPYSIYMPGKPLWSHQGFSDWAYGGTARGPWYYDGEIDHGLAGGLRAAATVVMDDPIFGKFAYGGSLTVEDGANLVVPRDGVRRRLHFVS